MVAEKFIGFHQFFLGTWGGVKTLIDIIKFLDVDLVAAFRLECVLELN